MSVWIKASEELPPLNEEAQSEHVLIKHGGSVDVAYYDEFGTSSDGVYMDTPAWVFVQPHKGVLSINDAIEWMRR